jgi:hypothetical protein
MGDTPSDAGVLAFAQIYFNRIGTNVGFSPFSIFIAPGLAVEP